MPSALITGANRGIGLALCRQLSEKGYEVHAVCRQASEELKAITPHITEGIDVAQHTCIERLKTAITLNSIDLVINVAGLLISTTWEDLDFEAIERQHQTNTLGPLRVAQAVWQKIPKGGKLVMITSRMGSIADNTSGGAYGYRMSKTGLNMASVSLAQDLKNHGIAVGIIHPGYVQTAMTENRGNIGPAEAAQQIIQRIDELNLENSGSFMHANGEQLPW